MMTTCHRHCQRAFRPKMIMSIHRRRCRRRCRCRATNVPCARARAVITAAAARAIAAISCALPCIHRLQFSRACVARARRRRSGLRFVYGTPGTPTARCYRLRLTCARDVATARCKCRRTATVTPPVVARVVVSIPSSAHADPLRCCDVNATVCARAGPRSVVYDQLFIIRFS